MSLSRLWWRLNRCPFTDNVVLLEWHDCTREDEIPMGKAVDYVLINLFEPALNWSLQHPLISVVVVGALIFFACRNYRML